MSGLDPYRDGRPSLAAENERLRRELARLRRRRAWPAAAALGGYVALVTALRGWLNGADPVRYWVALVALLLAFGVSVASALWLIMGRDD
ncbi:hypothetical protein WMF26_40065 [Sorangium sp. So ce185]|uniref:hypothetical protein n=1 Tax=Sorangium sp. So ce185 TaxID=3133287 RepID=UPI003F61E398